MLLCVSVRYKLETRIIHSQCDSPKSNWNLRCLSEQLLYVVLLLLPPFLSAPFAAVNFFCCCFNCVLLLLFCFFLWILLLIHRSTFFIYVVFFVSVLCLVFILFLFLLFIVLQRLRATCRSLALCPPLALTRSRSARRILFCLLLRLPCSAPLQSTVCGIVLSRSRSRTLAADQSSSNTQLEPQTCQLLH